MLRATALLLSAILLIACSGEDGDRDIDVTSTPLPLTATLAPEPSATAPAPGPSPTSQPEPSPTPSSASSGCGQALLSEGERSGLSQLSGRLIFSCEGQIWTSKPDGTEQTRITDPVAIDWDGVRLYRVPEDEPPSADERVDLESRLNYAPRWLADGRIAFASTRDTLALSAAAPDDARRPFVGATELYVVNADGSGLQRVTDYNLTAGAYDGPFSEFEPSQCADPRFCFAGLLHVVPASAATTEPVLAAQITEIRFSECCGFLALLDLSSTPPALAPAASLLGIDSPASVGSWHWAGSDRSSFITVWEEPPSPFELVYPDARLYTGDTFEVLPDVIGPGATLSPDGTRIAHCDVPAANASPTGQFVTEVDGSSTRQFANLQQSCILDWSPDGAHVVSEVSGQIVVVDVATGRSWRIARGSYPDWGP